MDKQPIEIERKFLIRMPSEETFRYAIKLDIAQTYLICQEGITERVRKLIKYGEVFYFKTRKCRINAISCFEEETAISAEDYEHLLKRADPTRQPINKIRYDFPYKKHVIEIDVYPFWKDRAILEIELGSEDEYFEIQPFISVIREVTEDRRYANSNIAKSIPMDDID